MAKLNLKTIAILSENQSTESLTNDPDMQAYVEEMQDVGSDVLNGLDKEELAVAVSFMQAMFSYQLLQRNPLLAMSCLSNLEDMNLSMIQALKFAVGVVLSEDWR